MLATIFRECVPRDGGIATTKSGDNDIHADRLNPVDVDDLAVGKVYLEVAVAALSHPGLYLVAESSGNHGKA